MNLNIDMINITEQIEIKPEQIEIEPEQIEIEPENKIKDKTIHQLKTLEFIEKIKNPVFKKNVIDTGTNWVVSSIYLVKKTKLERTMSTMVWEYYRHRPKLDVNEIIKKYKKENLIINYKIFQ